MCREIKFKVTVNYSPEDVEQLQERMAEYVANLVSKDLNKEQMDLLIKKIGRGHDGTGG